VHKVLLSLLRAVFIVCLFLEGKPNSHFLHLFGGAAVFFFLLGVKKAAVLSGLFYDVTPVLAASE